MFTLPPKTQITNVFYTSGSMSSIVVNSLIAFLLPIKRLSAHLPATSSRGPPAHSSAAKVAQVRKVSSARALIYIAHAP